MALTPENIQDLSKPLPLEDHEARAAGDNKAKTKTQWLIYLTQEGIIPRLNEVDPNWSWQVIETRKWDKYVAVTGRLTICGVSRDSTGGNSPNGASSPIDENTEKGAETDAFKRAAMRFSIGLYLRSQPMIWVDKTEKSWEDEKTALVKFADWYRKELVAQKPPQGKQNPTPAGHASDSAPKASSPASTPVTAKANGALRDDDPQAEAFARLDTPARAQNSPAIERDVDERPVYQCTRVKVVKSGNSHMYIVHTTQGANIAMFGGDMFRAVGLDPEPWKEALCKWFDLSPNLIADATLDGDAWTVNGLEAVK